MRMPNFTAVLAGVVAGVIFGASIAGVIGAAAGAGLGLLCALVVDRAIRGRTRLPPNLASFNPGIQDAVRSFTNECYDDTARARDERRLQALVIFVVVLLLAIAHAVLMR